MANIFLSYARTDAASAGRLARAVERAGHDVWWDRQIHGGARYSKEIKSALDRADVVLVLWSQQSVASDWVQDEAMVGRDSGRLVPVAIEPVEPPLGFRQIQTIDLVRWKGRSVPRDLLEAIESQAGSASEAGAPKPQTRRSVRLQRPALLALGAVIALLALFGIWQLAGSRLTGAAETPTLAVLPFADLSPEGDKAYFSEGVGEAILSLLSREPGIKVIGRSSAAQFRPGEADFREIRRALGVTHFLEGSARTAGEDLRMSVRLIDARDGAQVWAEDYQRRLSNIFAVQDEIGRAVAERLKGTLVSAAATASQQTTVDVYTLYLAMRSKMRGRDPQQLREALDIARRINEADPSYAPAFAAHAELIWLLSTENYGSIPRDEAYQRALPFARRAIQLAPNASEGHAALGMLLKIRDPASSILVLSRAAALDPSRAELRLWRAQSYVHISRNTEALKDFRRVTEVEPLWPVGHINLVSHLATAGQHSEVARVASQFEERGGSAAWVAWGKGIDAYLRGDLSEAIRHNLDARRLGLKVPHIDDFLTWAFHLASLKTSAEQASPSQPLYTRLFVTGRREPLLGEVGKTGASLWQSPDADVAVQALAAARDWNRLAQLYDSRAASLPPLCPDRAGGAVAWTRRASGSIAVNVTQALIAIGRREEALPLLDCVDRQLRLNSTGPVRREGFSDQMVAFTRAQIQALSGQAGEAMRSLERAVDRGWLGLYGANLRDYPAFDSLPAQELQRIQGKIDRQLARERAEIQRFCPNCR